MRLRSSSRSSARTMCLPLTSPTGHQSLNSGATTQKLLAARSVQPGATVPTGTTTHLRSSTNIPRSPLERPPAHERVGENNRAPEHSK